MLLQSPLTASYDDISTSLLDMTIIKFQLPVITKKNGNEHLIQYIKNIY